MCPAGSRSEPARGARRGPGAQAWQRTIRGARTGRGRGEGTREADRLAGAGRRLAGEAAGARMRGLTRAAFVAVLIAACARMAPPPGGPLRLTPPLLTATLPADSVCTLPDFRGAAEFLFDEVVSE